MKIKDLEWTRCRYGRIDHLHIAKCEFGRLTVLDRETGFGGGIRDVETGFTDLEGNFWLVSGNYDIREFVESDVEDEIKRLKDIDGGRFNEKIS